MKHQLTDSYLIESFNEEEAFSFGGLWQGDFKINDFILPEKYVLEDDIAIHANYCALIQIEVLGKWRNDIRFSIVVIDTSLKQVLKSKNSFSALSILSVSNNGVFYVEAFNVKEVESPNFLEFNDSNFIRIGDLPN